VRRRWALDYGTASAGEERLCRASFDTHLDGSEHFSRKVTILGLIALGAILVTGTVMAFTGRRGWRRVGGRSRGSGGVDALPRIRLVALSN